MVVKNPQTGNRTLDELIKKLATLGFNIKDASSKTSRDFSTTYYIVRFQHPKVDESLKSEYERDSMIIYSPSKDSYDIKLLRPIPNDSLLLLDFSIYRDIIPKKASLDIQVEAFRSSEDNNYYLAVSINGIKDRELVTDLVKKFYRLELGLPYF